MSGVVFETLLLISDTDGVVVSCPVTFVVWPLVLVSGVVFVIPLTMSACEDVLFCYAL